MTQYFQYGKKELAHLQAADKKLSALIEQIGLIKRPVIPDLFTALVRSIVGQQISSKACQTVWQRIINKLGTITPSVIYALSIEELQGFGISFRKANYIHSAAQEIITGNLDLNLLHNLSDKEVCAKLTKLNGVGIWTAEMLMIFSMQRPNILSWGDFAIQKGLRILYQIPEIDKNTFNQYWERYTPYASVASLYLWELAGKEKIDNTKKS